MKWISFSWVETVETVETVELVELVEVVELVRGSPFISEAP